MARKRNGHAAAASEREQRELECTLADTELQARADTMADCELLIEKLKEQRKGLNGQIADNAAERARLAHVIERRIEARMVECAWIDDFPKNVKRLIRQDTGAEVDTRPMGTADRQIGLVLPPVDEEAATLPPTAAKPAARSNGKATAAPGAAVPKKRGRPRKNAAAPEASVVHAH
jgi:hypothetical protein